MCQILYNSEKPDTFVHLMGLWFGEKHTIYTMGKEESLQLMVLDKHAKHEGTGEIRTEGKTLKDEHIAQNILTKEDWGMH